MKEFKDYVKERQDKDIDWDDYERRVKELEDEGLTRSDAQGVVDAEMMQEESVVNEATAEYEVKHKNGKTTVKARSEKEALHKAVKNLGLGSVAKDRPQDFKIEKLDR